MRKKIVKNSKKQEVVIKSDKGFVGFLLKVFEFYLRHYFVLDLLINILIIALTGSLWTLVLLLINFLEFLSWRKNVKPYKLQSMQFLDRCKSYHSMIFLGPVRSGKTSLSKFILNKFCTNPDLLYSSCEMPGYKAFTLEHLTGDKYLPEGCCVHVSEAGGFYDSFTYGNDHDEERYKIMNFNKYFGQNYGNDSYMIYEDQSSANMNTILKRTVVYYILNLSVSPVSKPIIPYLIYSMINKVFNFTTYNIFNLVAYDYKDFIKLDDFAEHYEINYDALSDKRFIVPAFRVFSGYDTRVFKKYNNVITKRERSYTWGSDVNKDKELMMKNYHLGGKPPKPSQQPRKRSR